MNQSSASSASTANVAEESVSPAFAPVSARKDAPVSARKNADTPVSARKDTPVSARKDTPVSEPVAAAPVCKDVEVSDAPPAPAAPHAPERADSESASEVVPADDVLVDVRPETARATDIVETVPIVVEPAKKVGRFRRLLKHK
jgi:hypothetical protein